MIVVGGVIPPAGLRRRCAPPGAAAIFPPGHGDRRGGGRPARAALGPTLGHSAPEPMGDGAAPRPDVADAASSGVRDGARADAGPGDHPGRVAAAPTTGSWRRSCWCELLPHAGEAHRVGITGVPGVGKSTFIDALGTHAHRGAGTGSRCSRSTRPRPAPAARILGDKTRMARLAVDRARVRPALAHRRARSAGWPGRRGRRCVLMEAAGYDVVLVETVGRRAVRDRGRRHGRHVPPADARPHRRPAAGHQEGHPRARRRHRGQQGRRRARARRRASPPASWPARCG